MVLLFGKHQTISMECNNIIHSVICLHFFRTIRIFLRDSLPCWELLANLRDGSSFNLLGPVGEPKQYPQEVTWHSWNDTTKWTKDGRFSIEESNGTEYENWMLKITQEPQPQNNNEQQPEKQTGGEKLEPG